MENEEKSGGIGAMIGMIIIIILLVAGGWYFISNRIEKIEEQKEDIVIEVSTGESTEIADIQTDLDNLNIDILNQ
jgi:preprotein translocase subunit YajC